MPIFLPLTDLPRRPRSPAPAHRRRSCPWIVARHRAQQNRAIAHRARERPGLIERGCKGDDAPARAAAVGRLDPNDAGERCRLADRAAGIGAGRAEHKDSRPPPPPIRPTSRPAPASRRSRAAATARPPGRNRSLVRRAHGEFVVIELAEQDRAVAPEIGGDGQLIGRNEAFEDVRAGGGAHARGAEQILDAERQPFERAALSSREPRVGRARHFAGAFGRFQHERVERARSFDGGEMRLGKFELPRILCLRSASRACASVSEVRLGHPTFGSSQENSLFSADAATLSCFFSSAGAGVGLSSDQRENGGCSTKYPSGVIRPRFCR